MDYGLLFDKIALPAEARELYYKLEEKRHNDKEFAQDVNKVLELHKDQVLECIKLTEELAVKYDIPLCSYQLYIQLVLCERAYDYYVAEGRDLEIYYDSMSDICVRIERNYRMFKSEHVGIDNFHWLHGFIYLWRFKAGRLEYDYGVVTIPFDMEYGGKKYTEGQKALKIHIPSYLKFNHELCMESYRKARKYLEEAYGEGDMPIVCTSWMVAPYLLELLGEGSSIADFINDFYIYEEIDAPEAPLEWVFGGKKEDPNEYPENTSLQRKLKKYIIDGGKVGKASGLLKY